MELADGDLWYLLVSRPSRTIGEAQLKTLMRQIVDGLEFLHDHHVVHRDIKPDNILIYGQNKDVAKLTDYSLVREADGETISKSYCGTRGYRAPELILKKFEEFKTMDPFKLDIWALGITMFEALTNSGFHNKMEGAAASAYYLNRLPPFLEVHINMISAIETCGASREVCFLLSEMLALYHVDRADIKQVKNHPWFAT